MEPSAGSAAPGSPAGHDRRAALVFDGVSIHLGGREIVAPTDLSIAPGEFVCIVGASGCGKTTLLRAAAGLLTEAAGQVRGRIMRNGIAVNAPSRDVAIVFQDYGRALLPWRSATGNVSLALEAAGMPAAERPERITRALQKVGLSAHADKFPGQLSGGMQQRLQIARCLAQQPSLLMMDEPFGALDALTRQGLQDEVARLVHEQGITALFVTHDLDEAIYLGDRVIAMQASPGRITRTIDVPLARPRHQLSSREHPEFLRLRRELFNFIESTHG